MSEKKDKIPPTDMSNTPNGKKLKQTRLSFKPVESSPKVGTSSGIAGETRKRKLSTNDDDNRSTKVSKIVAAKENIVKADEVTVLEMVDLVESDIDMTDNETPTSSELTKETKKSTKDTVVVGTGTPLRRSSRKNDSECPAKVVIKIPSAKKKKVNERPSKAVVVAKIDENDEDDDVILIDSEENSLNSVDGKQKGFKADDSIVPTEDESDSVLDGDIGSNLSTSESTKSVPTKEEATDSTVTSSVKEVSDNGSDAKETKVITEDMVTEAENVSNVEVDTNRLDATIADEEELSSSSALTVSDKDDGSNAKEENLLTSANEPISSDLDSGVNSNGEAKMDSDFDQSKVSTPTSSKVGKRNRKSIEVMNSPKTPVMKTGDKNSLTPKQLQKKLDSEQKRLAKEKAKEERERKIQEAKEERERKIQEAKEERERKIQEAKEERERKIQEAKEERERKQQEEKEQRQRERDEKERIKKKERDDKEEQKRKEREDKEEQRRREKEEREKKKQAEIDAKNEEKRLKEEEKIAKEEAELKKKRKEAEAFTKFFAKKSNKSTEYDKMDVDDAEVKMNFMPFRVKPDMRLAPIIRRQLSPTRKSKFDGEVFASTEGRPTTELYIQSLRSRTTEKQGKTWPNEENNDDVILIDELEGATSIEETSTIQKYRAKFFKFEENRRPPYYGTWHKKSSVITPRRPFATDEKFFDYEIDSDDEWEDEEPGESLHGSDDEKDKESDDDYDIDNEFFVPHGHLSDEELANNDEIDEDNTPDTQKAKLKIMQKVFSDEMKKKTEKIKPRLIGLIWQNKDGGQPVGCPPVIWDMLQIRAMIFNGPTVVIPTIQIPDKSDAADEAKKGSAVKKRMKLADDSLSDLIRLIHGNTNSSEFLSKEFRAFTVPKNKDDDKVQEVSLSSIRLKIKELAEWKPCPEEGPMMGKFCWYVPSEQRKNYGMESLSIINDWAYTLTPKSKLKSESKKAKENEKVKTLPDAPDELPASAKTPKSKLGNIEKFTKVLSDDDKKKNFSIVQDTPIEAPSPTPKPKTAAEPSPKPAKKRVKLLMSVPRGQEIPVQTKNSLISQYLSSVNSNKKSTDAEEPICIDD